MTHQGKWIKKWEVPSEDGDKTYTVSLSESGTYGCSCPRWVFFREDCKHILSVKSNGGSVDNYMDAVPGNVPEVIVKEDIILYPLVPFGPAGTDLAATIVYDLQRAGAYPAKVKEYRERFFNATSMKRIIEHVQAKGRFVYTRFEERSGWVDPVYTSCDMPVKKG